MNRFILSMLAGLAATFSAGAAEQSEKPFTTAHRYNLNGQVTGTISPDPDGSGPLKYLAVRTTYARGLVAMVESGELQSWVSEDVAPANWEQASGFTRFVIDEYLYDAYGRKIQELVRRADTAEIQSLVQFKYDKRGRVSCRAERMNKDAFGSLPDACTPGPAGSHGPDRISRFTYDDLDQVLTEERGVGTPLQQTYVRNVYSGRLLLSQTDANGNRTEFRYDDQRRLARRVFPSRAFPDLLNERDYEEYTYEPTGAVRTARSRNGQIITYTYDATNKVRTKDLSDNTHSQDVFFDYYPHGDLRYARHGSHSGPGVTSEIDPSGSVTAIVTNTPAATSSSGPSRRVSYEYDDHGNRIAITHPDGARFGYAFDGLDRNCGVAEGFVPSSCAASGLMVAVSYRHDGGRKSLARGSSITTYLPDAVGRLEQLTHDLPGTADDLTNSFVYSPSGQIARFTQSNASYAYAGNGNRAGDYARNGLNQVTSLAGSAVAHDANGNLTVDPGLSFSMTYDIENRLVATNGGSASVILKYDPRGRLSRISANATITEFLYDGDELIAEYQNGTLSRRFVHGDRVDEPWLEYEGSAVGAATRRYLLADQQGSIVARTDNAGGNVRKLAYDSFGFPRDTNEGRFGYTGQMWLRELGLYYYKARFYSPGLGRFLQTDPVGYKDNLNLYAYVRNDPINSTDPSGREQCPVGKPNCTFHGTPQKTNGPDGQAHADAGLARGEQAGASGEAQRVHYNQSLRTVTGDPTVSNQRPDVTIVRNDGKIDVHEDVSTRSQTVQGQLAKGENMLNTLKPELRGTATATPVPRSSGPTPAFPGATPPGGGAILRGVSPVFTLYEIVKWALISSEDPCAGNPSCI